MGVTVIAEVGCNHEGSVDTALSLIHTAKLAGADAVKFQAFDSQALWGDDRIKHLELSQAEFRVLADYCAAQKIEFMCTPFGVPEVEFLAPMVKRMKVASGCLAKKDLLHAVRDTGLPVILSTGMSTLNEVRLAMDWLGYQSPHKYKQAYTLLHCLSTYPAPPAEINLRAMDVLRHEFGQRCAIGYSDHSDGIAIPLAAVALGAQVIEKHLTYDTKADGPDHAASITGATFAQMVYSIHEVEAAIGDWRKTVQPSEAALRRKWGRE